MVFNFKQSKANLCENEIKTWVLKGYYNRLDYVDIYLQKIDFNSLGYSISGLDCRKDIDWICNWNRKPSFKLKKDSI